MKSAKTLLRRLFLDWNAGLVAVLLSAVLVGTPAVAQTVISSSSSYASFILAPDGNLYVFGTDNYLHTPTNGTVAQDSVPVKIPFPAGVTAWTDAASGHGQELAIGNDGNIYAWGYNNYGQLGDGTTTNSDTLVKVSLPGGVKAVQVAAAWTHSLALGNDGNIYGWGFNNNGQLGDNTTTSSSSPVKVQLPAGFTPAKIFAGWYYSAALGTDSTVYVWGGNAQGQLGLGNTTKQLVPVEVPFPTGVTKWTGVYCGIYFLVLQGNDGNLYASGYDQYGQLGDGTTTNSTSLVKVNLPAGVTGWKTAACTGSAVLAVASNDSLYGWGYNGDAALGNGQSGVAINSTPTTVQLPAGVTASSVTAGRDHVLAVGSDNYYYAWGQGTQGQLGNDSLTSSSLPVTVYGVLQSSPAAPSLMSPADGATGQLTDVVLKWNSVQAATGYQCQLSTDPAFKTGIIANDSALAVTADTVSGLGNGIKYYWRVRLFENGVAGAYSTANSFTTTQAAFTPNVYSSSTSFASFAVTPKGQLYGWGEDQYHHTVESKTVAQDQIPVMIDYPAGVTSWISAASGHLFTLALANTGDVYAWGVNNDGQLGDGTTNNADSLVKVQLPNGVKAISVAAGLYHSLAVGNDGNVYAWGANAYGQLGDGTTTSSNVPVKVALPAGFTPVTVYASYYYSIAVGADGSAYAWGLNGEGQFGIGNTTNQLVPVKIPFPKGVTKWNAFYGGIYFLGAMGNDGNLYASGYNNYGELGDGTTVNSDTMVKAALPPGVTSWKSGGSAASTMYGIADNDTLYSWGYGGSGELGNGSSGTAAAVDTVAVKVALPTGVHATAVTGGRFHGLAMGSDGFYYAWGSGAQGQLGDDSLTSSYVPVRVFGLMQNAPAAPVLTSPTGNATVPVTNVVLEWNPLSGSNDYQCQVATDPTFQTGLFANDSALVSTADTISGLNFSTKYYWRVRSIQNGIASAYSLVDSFTTVSGVPASPGLVSPRVSTIGVPRVVTFNWAKSSLAGKYLLEVSTSSLSIQSGDSTGYFKTAVFDTIVTDTTVKLSVPLAPTTLYYWHVSAIDTIGMSDFSATWEFKTGTGLTGIDESAGIPKTFALMQNYPNPFNPTTVVKYNLPKAQNVTLKVYNVLGQAVATLVDAHQNAGYYQVTFNADRFASGVYFYILRTDNFSAIHKMMLLK